MTLPDFQGMRLENKLACLLASYSASNLPTSPRFAIKNE
jgi:hypothetical protein